MTSPGPRDLYPRTAGSRRVKTITWEARLPVSVYFASSHGAIKWSSRSSGAPARTRATSRNSTLPKEFSTPSKNQAQPPGFDRRNGVPNLRRRSEVDMQKVGFIGLGAMGPPVATLIQKAGFPMVVCDLRED